MAIVWHNQARRGGNQEPLTWPEVYGLIMTSTGWKPWEVDEMLADDLLDLSEHWKKYPPTHLAIRRAERQMLAAQGFAINDTEPTQKPGVDRPAFVDEAELRSLVAQVNGA